MDKTRYQRDLYTACLELCTIYKTNILFKIGLSSITFDETLERIRNRALFLSRQGYAPGDVIGILASNSPEWCITFLAIVANGGIALPMDTGLDAATWKSMLDLVEARGIFVSQEFNGIALNIQIMDITEPDIPSKDDEFIPPIITRDTIAAVLFTSGTTGKPKIVQLTHSNLLHIACVCTDLEEYTSADVTLAILPFFHVYALEATFLAPFVTGSTIVIHTSLKGPDIMKALADNPITIFPAAPLMWELFFDAITAKVKNESAGKYRLFMFMVDNAPLLKKLGLGFIVKKVFAPVHSAFGLSHRFFISGGAPMKREYFTRYRNMGFNIMEGYGLSETTGPIAIPYYKKGRPGCVGRPIPGNKVLVKNTGDDGIGEIWLRGDAVMNGYYRNDEANRAVFDSQGFFNTGDLGRLDGSGAIHVTGRMKNVIVLDSGKKVYPEELEFYFRNSPMISEIAVFERRIDGHARVWAVVVPVEKTRDMYNRLSEEIKRMNAALPAYRRISGFGLSPDELPKNSTRKILYSEITSRLELGIYQETGDDTAVLNDMLKPAGIRDEEIIHILKNWLRADKLFHNQTLEDFAVDSLGMVGLITCCEESLGIRISMDDFKHRKTLGEIVQYLGSLEPADGESLDTRILAGPIRWKTNGFFNPLHHMVLGLLKYLSGMLWHVKVMGAENFSFNNTVIVANHQSYLDIVWLAYSIPPRHRGDVYVIAKRKLSFLRFIFPILPVIYVDEGNTIEVLEAGSDLLRQGRTLIIYPEGTRTPDGDVHEFKNGAAYLAWHLKKTVIPVSVCGAWEIWPRHRRLPSIVEGKKGCLNVGHAIDPSGYASVDELNSALRNAVEKGRIRTELLH